MLIDVPATLNIFSNKLSVSSIRCKQEERSIDLPEWRSGFDEYTVGPINYETD